MTGNFNDIYDELTWEFFKESGGNPLIACEWVAERNAVREKELENKRKR